MSATSLPGYRSALMVFREVAEMTEKNPRLPHPHLDFKPVKVDGRVAGIAGQVKFHAWGGASYDSRLPGTYAERKRLGIEIEINAILDAFGPEVAWVANDPSESGYDKDYFQLSATWHGMEVTVVTMRADVGEEITVIESGPQVITDGDTVQLVRQSATVWKPNIAIGRRATPAYELESAPLVLAVEA